MRIDSFDAVFSTLTFIVPGFIADSVLGLMIPRRSSGTESSVVRFLTFSCFNYALWSWLIYLIVKTELSITRPSVASALWAFIILLSPILLGVLVAKARQGGFVTKMLSRVGLPVIQPNPTAWDQFFITAEPQFVLVTLKDGSTVAGRFGPRSAASSDAIERDLYIESVYRVGEPWTEIEGNGGVWIRGDEIRYLEFWPLRYNP